MTIRFEPRDIWVGLYWTRETTIVGTFTHFYVCPVPCLVIHWRRRTEPP